MHRLVSAAIGALVWLSASTVHAQIVEQIVAWIGDDAIYASELASRVGKKRTREAYRVALSTLIDERLVEHEARRLGVVVEDAMVDQFITEMRLKSGLDEEAFWDAVGDEWSGREHFRNDTRGRLLLVEVMSERAQSDINVEEPELRRRYAAELRGGIEYGMRTIIFPFGHDEDAARADAEAVLAKLRTDDVSFDEAFAANDGETLGPIRADELASSVAGALEELEVGETSRVVRSDSFFLIFLLETRDLPDMPAFEDVRERLESDVKDERRQAAEERMFTNLRRGVIVVLRI